jgi:hypothetical protein
MFDADMQCGIGAHGMPDDVGVFDAKRVHQCDDIGTCEILAIARRIVGNVRRRIAALTERDAAMRAAEMAHLRLPGAVVTGKFMDEDDRRSRPGFLVIQIHAVTGSDFRHRVDFELLAPMSPLHASQNA